MTPLHSEAGKKRLDQIVQPGVLCVFDFDGTLSPIVSQYDDARLPAHILEKLLILSALTPVAILTGRAIDDIQPRLHFQPHYLIGNHGLEGMPGWKEQSALYHAQNKHWYETLKRALEDPQFRNQGIKLENKEYSLAVHYRFARDPKLTEQQLLALFAQVAPKARIIEGKFVFSIIPPDAPHKGNALEKLVHMSKAPSVLYVGDDITDEDVFHLQRPDLLSIRIAHSPDSAAAHYLEKWEDMAPLLDELISRLKNHENRGKTIAKNAATQAKTGTKTVAPAATTSAK